MGKSPVRVFVRTRPCGVHYSGFRVKGTEVTVESSHKKVAGPNHSARSHTFQVDGVLDGADQQQVFEDVVAPLVAAALDGYNAAVLCYGQTGAGKTYSMCGGGTFQERGLVPRAIEAAFRAAAATPDHAITLRISCLEIYNDELYDLLAQGSAARARLACASANGAADIKGLSKRTAVSVEEALAMFMAAQHARATAAHGKHSASSRSHFIFTLHCDIRRSGAMTESATASHLHLVDLAGVERYHAQTPAGPPSLATSVYGCREMCSINRSLANLEHVAASLARQQPHVPFRESHLTLVLRDALAGKSHTALIANVWPEEAHVAETVSTLRLVSRMRLVSTVPCQNEASDPDTLLRRYKRQICDLRAELAMRDTLNGRARVHYGDFSTAQEADVSALVARFLAGAIALEDLPLDTVKSIKELLAQCQAAYRTAASAASVAAADMSADPTPGGSAERLEEPGKTGANDPGVGDLAPATGFGIGAAPDSARQPPPAKVRAGSLSPSKAAPSGHCVAASKGACAGGGSSYMAPAVGAGSQHHATADRAPATTMSLPRRPVAIDQQAAFVCFKGCSEAGRAAVAELRAARASSKAARMMTSKEAEQVNRASDDLHKVAAVLRDRMASMPEGSAAHAVPDEEVSALQASLSSLKGEYKSARDALAAAHACVEAASIAENGARRRLIACFEAWLAVEGPLLALAAAGVGANDQFRQLQENGLLPGEEGALAFLEAQRRVSSAKCQVPSFPGAKGKAFAARRRELAAACPQVA